MHPTPPAPVPPRRNSALIAVAAGGALVVLAVILLAVVGMVADDPAEPTRTPAASTPATNSPPAARAVPSPSPAQQRAYLAAIARIDPGLVADRERALRRAGRICERIVQPPGGTLTLERYTVLELSGGNARIDEAQARQVIRAVKVWCR